MIETILSAGATIVDRLLLGLGLGWNWISQYPLVAVLCVALVIGVSFGLRRRV